MSSPLAIAPLDSSMPMVRASEGELGRGGSLAARLVDDWLAWERLVGDSCPEVDDVGLSFLAPFLADVPRRRAFLAFVSSSVCLGEAG